MMNVRGIRGATTVAEDRPEAIMAATRELLEELLSQNPTLRPEDMGSVTFSLTSDLSAANPAEAARQMGWTLLPLFCLQEAEVIGSLPRVIRLLVLWNTDLPQEGIRHVYLGKAAKLRPDLARP